MMTNADTNIGKWRQWSTPGGKAKPYNLYGNWSASGSKRKKETCLPYDLTVLLFHINLDLVSYAILLTDRRESRCSSYEKLMRKRWCIFTMEYYSAIEKNENLNFRDKCIGQEAITLNKLSQT